MENTLPGRVAQRLGIGAGIGTALTLVSFMLVGPASAQTDTDPEVVNGMQELGTDVGVYAAAAVVLIALGVAFWLGIKYLVKAANKA